MTTRTFFEPCRNLGDVNTDPALPPDNVFTRGLL